MERGRHRPMPLGFESAEVDLKTEMAPSERNTDNSGAHDSVVPVNALPCRRDSSRDPKLNLNSHDGVVRSAIVHPDENKS